MDAGPSVPLIDDSAVTRSLDHLTLTTDGWGDIVGHIDEVIFSVDLLRDVARAISPSAASLFGLPPDYFLTTPGLWRDTLVPPDVSTHAKATSVQVGETVRARSYAIRRPDGQRRWIWGRYTLGFDPAGRPARLDGILSDVTEHKQEGEALVEREAYFRVLTEHAADLIEVVEADRTIRYASPARARVLGASGLAGDREDLFDRLHPDDATAATELWARVVATPGLTYTTEVRCRHHDGSWRTLEMTLTNLLQEPAVRGIVLNIRDVTERVRAKEAQRASEESFRLLFHDNPHPMFVYDLHTLQLLEVNDAACSQYGYSREEFLAMRAPDVYPPDELEQVMPLLVGDRPPHVRTTGPWRHQCKDGGAIEVEVTSHPTTFAGHLAAVAVAFNVTERLRAERAVRISEEQYRRIVETAQEGIWLLDADHRTAFVNQKMADMLGYTVPEMLARSVFDFLALDVHQAVQERLEIGQHGFTHVHETRYRRKDGAIVRARLATNPVFDDGRYLGALALVTDVTQQRLVEEQLREANQRLEETLAELQSSQQQIIQQERLRALGEMASGIAHDFNNALAQIQGYVELLLAVRPEELEDPARVRTYLGYVQVAATDAAHIVERLRAFYRARDDGEVFVPVDLDDLVREVIELTQPRWKVQAQAQGVSIRVNADLGGVPVVQGNPCDLRQALTNLVFNAIDALSSGGTVTLRTRVVGDRAVVDVSDDGIGMSDEVRRRCLDPFFTTKKTKGTGLGLALVYGVIQRHHGTLEVASVLGKGTTITFNLPLTHRAEFCTAMGGEPPSSLGHHVLVVDDEPAIREILTAFLTADGHVVASAANGREGLERFRSGGFDLVVTDLAMPELGGDQLATRIKRERPDVPVILLTGFGTMMHAANEKPDGVDLILGKPLGRAALRRALAMAFGEGCAEDLPARSE